MPPNVGKIETSKPSELNQAECLELRTKSRDALLEAMHSAKPPNMSMLGANTESQLQSPAQDNANAAKQATPDERTRALAPCEIKISIHEKHSCKEEPAYNDDTVVG